MTCKRAITVADIQSIINVPYEKEIIGGRWSRFNLAKDCFLLSLGLIGMNSADMITCNPDKKGVLTYNREKTKDRRAEKAEMKVRIENCIKPLIKNTAIQTENRCFRLINIMQTSNH